MALVSKTKDLGFLPRKDFSTLPSHQLATRRLSWRLLASLDVVHGDYV